MSDITKSIYREGMHLCVFGHGTSLLSFSQNGSAFSMMAQMHLSPAQIDTLAEVIAEAQAQLAAQAAPFPADEVQS